MEIRSSSVKPIRPSPFPPMLRPENRLAHRGWWTQPAQRNTPDAITAALQRGFGVETDLRDYAGKVVISHDPPRSAPPWTLDDLLRAHRTLSPQSSLALNIKSDGLAQWVQSALHRHGTQNHFTFDMSVPDQRDYQRLGIPVYRRVSEWEPSPTADELPTAACPGLWLDAFDSDWYSVDLVQSLLDRGWRVCLVSPELHRRERLGWQSQWVALRNHPDLSICTDHPDDPCWAP